MAAGRRAAAPAGRHFAGSASRCVVTAADLAALAHIPGFDRVPRTLPPSFNSTGGTTWSELSPNIGTRLCQYVAAWRLRTPSSPRPPGRNPPRRRAVMPATGAVQCWNTRGRSRRRPARRAAPGQARPTRLPALSCLCAPRSARRKRRRVGRLERCRRVAAAPTRSALVRYSARWGSRRGVLGTGLQRNSSTHDFVFVLSFKQLWQSISISTNIRVSLPIFYLCCQSESENPGLGQGEDLKDVPGCPGVQIRSITVATDSNAGAPPCSIAAAELAAPSPGSPPPPRTLREDALAAAADVARPSSIGRDAGSLGYHLGVLAEASAAGGEPVPCAAGRSGTHPPPYAMLSAATAPPEACGGGHTPYQRRLLSERAVAAMVLQGNGAPLGGDALARLCDAAARGPAAASASPTPAPTPAPCPP